MLWWAISLLPKTSIPLRSLDTALQKVSAGHGFSCSPPHQPEHQSPSKRVCWKHAVLAACPQLLPPWDGFTVPAHRAELRRRKVCRARKWQHTVTFPFLSHSISLAHLWSCFPLSHAAEEHRRLWGRNGPKIFRVLKEWLLYCSANSTLVPKTISISTSFFFLVERLSHPLHTKERIRKAALCIWKMGNTYQVNGAVWCLSQTTTSVDRRISRGNKNKREKGQESVSWLQPEPFFPGTFAQLDIKHCKISFIKKEASFIFFHFFSYSSKVLLAYQLYKFSQMKKKKFFLN